MKDDIIAGVLALREENKALRECIVELRNALEYYADEETGWELVEHADAYEDSLALVPDTDTAPSEEKK